MSQQLSTSIEAITNAQLRKSIANISQLMDKINDSIHNQENLVTETDEYMDVQKVRQKLGRIKLTNNPYKKHERNKLSTVMEESITNSQVTNTPRDYYLGTKETILQQKIQNIETPFSKMNEDGNEKKAKEYCLTETSTQNSLIKKISGIRKRKTEGYAKNMIVSPQQQITINIERVMMGKGKKIIEMTQNSGKKGDSSSNLHNNPHPSKRYIGLRQLVARKEITIQKSNHKKGLSIFSKGTHSHEKRTNENKFFQPMSAEKEKKKESTKQNKQNGKKTHNIKIIAVDMKKIANQMQEIGKMNKKNSEQNKTNLRDFYNSKRITK